MKRPPDNPPPTQDLQQSNRASPVEQGDLLAAVVVAGKKEDTSEPQKEVLCEPEKEDLSDPAAL